MSRAAKFGKIFCGKLWAQPIAWLILTKLNRTTSQNNTKAITMMQENNYHLKQKQLKPKPGYGTFYTICTGNKSALLHRHMLTQTTGKFSNLCKQQIAEQTSQHK